MSGVLSRGSYKPLDLEKGSDVAKADQIKEDRAKIRKLRNELEDYLIKQFEGSIEIIPSTQESLARFDQLMQDDKWEQLEKLEKEMKTWVSPNTLSGSTSFRYDARLQPVLVRMLKDTDKYQDYLELFIVRFQAENKLTRPKYYSQSKADATNPKEDRPTISRQISESEPNTTESCENENCASKCNPESAEAAKQSAPIHYAVLQLNESFLKFLLKCPSLDVNMRDNHKKRTALTLLCENYDQCLQTSKKPCPAHRLAKIQKCVKQLLEAKADFNICTAQIKLPFELLLKHRGHDEKFFEECVKLAPNALVIRSKENNERKERVVGFYNNNPNVLVTVELLEIFLRCKDRTKFEAHLKNFKVNETNVKKVIRLLLHTACDQNLTDCVRLILDHCEKDIFKVVQPSSTQVGSTVTNRQTASSSNNVVKDSNTVSSEQPIPGTSSTIKVRDNARDEKVASGKSSAVKGPNDASREQEAPCSLSSATEKSRSSEQEKKGSELEHRVELKGLLKKICLMADLSLLQRFLAKISDLILLNDEPLLVHTLRKANFSNCIEERNQLIACAEYLATQETIHMSKKDNSGNTSLHLAIKYGFDSVARLLLRQQYSDLGMRNKANLTPLDYGTYEFWKNYFDSCIEVPKQRNTPDLDKIHFNMNGFYSPLHEKLAVNPTVNNVDTDSSSSWKKLLQKAKTFINPETPTNAVTEMMILQQIAQSKELKRLLIHPVINTFIMVKWTRLCQWNCLNLLLTGLTIVFFTSYSFNACSAESHSFVWKWLSVSGVVFVVIRELLQLLFLGRSYLSWENLHDITIVISMITVLWIGCSGLVSSFVIISLAIQFTFLLASVHPTKFATIMYMFKTVSISFFKSFGFFSPLILSFIYAFHLTYNQSPEDQEQVCDEDDCAQKNFNNFRTFWNTTVKTLVMTTGEFEAASLNFEGGKMLLFLAFVFVAPIVILNLINGLAVSDIAAIRLESELISISKKVMLLEQYERGAANVRPVFLKRYFPKPFFSEYQSRIHVKTKEHSKIVVYPKLKPKEQSKSSHGSNKVDNLLHNDNDNEQEYPKIRQQRSSQRVVSNKQNGQKSSNGKPKNNSPKPNEGGKALAKFPWLCTWESCKFISEISFFREAFFMYLEHSILDEAQIIVEKRKGNAYQRKSLTKVSECNKVATNDRQQKALRPEPSRNQRNGKQTTRSEDEVLRELSAMKKQLTEVLEMQKLLKTGLCCRNCLRFKSQRIPRLIQGHRFRGCFKYAPTKEVKEADY